MKLIGLKGMLLAALLREETAGRHSAQARAAARRHTAEKRLKQFCFRELGIHESFLS